MRTLTPSQHNIMDRLVTDPDATDGAHRFGMPLNARMVEALALYADGLTYEGAAHRMGTSRRTYDRLLRAARSRLGARSSAHAIDLAHDRIVAFRANR